MQSRLAQQQKRNLSIHEYLSARLLKSVCEPRLDSSVAKGESLFFCLFWTTPGR